MAPKPEKSNHMSGLVVLHRASRTIHVDDTFMCSHDPGFLMKVAGFKDGTLWFHTSLKGPGLYPTPEAPLHFSTWVQSLIDEWDFVNICTAHNGNKLGDAKQALQHTLDRSQEALQKLSKKNAAGKPPKDVGAWGTDESENCECG